MDRDEILSSSFYRLLNLRSKRQKNVGRETSGFLFSLLIWLRCNYEANFEKMLHRVVCGSPSKLSAIRRPATLVRMLSRCDLRSEEKAVRRKWKYPR